MRTGQATDMGAIKRRLEGLCHPQKRVKCPRQKPTFSKHENCSALVPLPPKKEFSGSICANDDVREFRTPNETCAF